jgi:hypothetical protein
MFSQQSNLVRSNTGRSIQAHLDSPQFAASNQMFPMKKVMVHGMMDFAFLSANASQLRLILRAQDDESGYRILSITMIALSIAFQVLAINNVLCGYF